MFILCFLPQGSTVQSFRTSFRRGSTSMVDELHLAPTLGFPRQAMVLGSPMSVSLGTALCPKPKFEGVGKS